MRKVLDMPDGPGISLQMERESGTKVSIQRQVSPPPPPHPPQCLKATATCLQDALEESGKDKCSGSGFNAGVKQSLEEWGRAGRRCRPGQF